MKIEITAGGIYGADGEVKIGTIVTVNEKPKGWEGRYRVVSGDDDEGKDAVINPDLDRDELKKQAAELGLQYAANIPSVKLKELIDAKLAE